jgi:hypothetical protein
MELRHRARLKRRREAGVAIVLVMFFILLVLGMTVASGLLTRQNFTNFRSHDREAKARYAAHAALQTGLHYLSNDSTWSPTEANPHIEYLDPPTNSIGFKTWFDGVNRNSSVPVVTASGQTLSRGQAIMRVTVLVDGHAEEGFTGGAESLRLEQPEVPYSFSLLQGSTDTHQHFQAFYCNFLSYSSSPLTPVAPVDFDWDPRKTFHADWWMTDYGTRSLQKPVPVSNQRGSFRDSESDIPGMRRQHVSSRVLGTYSPTSEVADSVTFWDSVVPASAAWLVDDEPWVPIRFDYPRGMRGLTGGIIANAGVLAPGFYSVVQVPPGQTLTLERGATYGIKQLSLQPGAHIILTGSSTEPCLVYFERFGSTGGSKVNMPVPGGATSPLSWDLHLLGVGDSEVSILSSQVAAVLVTNYFNGHNIDWYGTVITSRTSSSCQRSNFHFDEAIRGREAPAEPNWILVNQARNG